MTLRFGIMCYGTTLAAWEAECVHRLLAIGVRPAGLIVEKKPPRPPVRWPLIKKVKTLFTAEKMLWLFYERLFVDGRIPALRPADMSGILGALPLVECETARKGRFSEYFQETDLTRIRELNLDFILRFAFGIIRGAILDVPRYGVWSFHHDDEEKYRGGPPGFWEIYESDPQTGAMLQRLTDRLDSGVVLRKGGSQTVNDSFVRNRDTSLSGCTAWPAEVCGDILAGNDSPLFAPPSTSAAPIYHSPDNRQMVRFLGKIARNYLGNRLPRR